MPVDRADDGAKTNDRQLVSCHGPAMATVIEPYPFKCHIITFYSSTHTRTRTHTFSPVRTHTCASFRILNLLAAKYLVLFIIFMLVMRVRATFQTKRVLLLLRRESGREAETARAGERKNARRKSDKKLLGCLL